jgi:hypothetical protein
MIVIDACSHFTKTITPFATPPRLSEKLTALVSHSRLSFGHWEIGDQHDTFVVLLRAMRDTDVASIFSDLHKHCQKEFGANKAPDLILFPGDSTAIHLATRIREEFGGKPGLVVASPAFRERGKYELRLEISSDHLTHLRQRRRLDVLFFDDSLSSGETENHILEAFIRDTANYRDRQNMRWLTYTVLHRRRQTADTASVSKRETPLLATQQLMSYRFAAFDVIGPESLNRANCPLCRASERVRQAVSWAEGARPPVREILEKLDSNLEARPIERLVSPLSFLDPLIACELLQLEAMPIPEACVYVWQQIRYPNGSSASAKTKIAQVIFLALHYEDIASYVSLEDTLAVIEKTSEQLNLDDPSQRDAFLVGLSTFPPSILQPVLLSIVSRFVSHGAIDLATTLLAIAFSSQHHTLLEVVSRDALQRRREVLLRRRKELAERAKVDLSVASSKVHEAFPGTREIVTADLSTIGSPPRGDRPEWVARTLSALLHRGGHPSFLSEQIRNVTPDTVLTIRNGLLQAIELIQRLPLSTIGDVEETVTNLQEQLRSCESRDVDKCRQLAEKVTMTLWEEMIHAKLAVYPKVLQSYVQQSLTTPKKEYPNSHIKMEHLIILQCDDADLDCEAFGPGKVSLKSHIKNLLVNPFKHFPITEFDSNSGDSPVAVIYIRLDDSHENLLLVAADRSKPPRINNLWTLRSGLANVRASMQIFGGDVNYFDVAQGFLCSTHAPTANQQQIFLDQGFNPSRFKNLFVTSFPIIRQTL